MFTKTSVAILAMAASATANSRSSATGPAKVDLTSDLGRTKYLGLACRDNFELVVDGVSTAVVAVLRGDSATEGQRDDVEAESGLENCVEDGQLDRPQKRGVIRESALPPPMLMSSVP